MRNEPAAPAATPYDVESDANLPTLSARTRVIVGLVGILVLAGSVLTLGFFLFALLVIFVVPVSPFVVFAFGGIVAAACFAMKRFVLHARAAEQATRSNSP